MIYDRLLTIYDVSGGSVLGRKLIPPGTAFFCARRTVGLSRYYTALAVGDRTDDVLELPGYDGILPTQIAAFEGAQYRILQVQHAADPFGLPITVLSLSRLEELYELDEAETTP